MTIKILIILFILFAISRLILRFKDSDVDARGFIFWLLLWLGVGVVALIPKTADLIAKILGVGRGVDAVIYIAIIILLFGFFKIVVKLEHIEYEVTKIVRKQSLDNGVKSKHENINTK